VGRRFYLFASLIGAPLMHCGPGLAQEGEHHGELVRVRGPEPLSFDELVKLATADPPPEEVQAKLDRLDAMESKTEEASLHCGSEVSRLRGWPLSPSAARLELLLDDLVEDPSASSWLWLVGSLAIEVFSKRLLLPTQGRHF
jgi:hypothetical protein